MSDHNVTVTLPAYRWSELLAELADAQRVCNHDQRRNILLYQDIGTQLNGAPVVVIHPQNPDPKCRPVKEAPPAIENPIAKRKRWFGLF